MGHVFPLSFFIMIGLVSFSIPPVHITSFGTGLALEGW